MSVSEIGDSIIIGSPDDILINWLLQEKVEFWEEVNNNCEHYHWIMQVWKNIR